MIPAASALKVAARIAWRSLRRKRRRTTRLLLLVAYAATVIIIYAGIVDGYERSVIEAHAAFITAPVEVARATYFADPDPSNALTSLGFLSALRAKVQGRAVSPRLDLPVLLRSAYATVPVVARGVDPAQEVNVSEVASRVREGRWLAAPGEVVLGAALARKLDVRIGERLVVDSISSQSSRGLGLVLVGMVDSGIASVDRSGAVVDLADARWLSGRTTATSIAVTAPRGQEASVARAIQAVLPTDVRALPVGALLGAVKTDIQAAKLSVLPMGVLLALFAAIAVTSTMMVSLQERSRELSVLQALGCMPGWLTTSLAIETTLIVALGWILGTLVGYAALEVLAHVDVLGFVFAPATQVWPGTGLTAQLYAAVQPMYGAYALGAVLVGGVATIMSAAIFVRQLDVRRGLLT